MSREGSSRPFGVVLPTMLVVLAFASGFWFAPFVGAHEEAPSELFEGAETLLVPYDKISDVRQDGIISDSEYDPYGHWLDEEEGVHLYMEHDDASLYVALVNGLGGWAAVGFGESEEDAFDANVVWWNDTVWTAEDRFIPLMSDELETSLDVSQAGTGDLYGYTGSFEDSSPVFEFRLPLMSGDDRDVALESGHVYSGFVAFSNETPAPESLAEGDTHFFRLYVLRSTDDPAQIHELFEGAVLPKAVPTLVAVAIVAFGVLVLMWHFLPLPGRRGR